MHFANFVALICNSQPFFRTKDYYIYIGYIFFQMAVPYSRTMPFTEFFPTSKTLSQKTQIIHNWHDT